MTPQTALPRARKFTSSPAADATADVAPAGAGDRKRFHNRRPTGGTQYRLFMTLVFCGIVAFNVSSNQDVSPTANNELVGLASVAVWILTLLGAFAVGPFRALRRALGW